MAKQLITGELWEVIEPLLPPEPDKAKGRRPRIPNRDVLRGILCVLSTGLPWEYLPPEMGCGSGMTCWRRLKEWHGGDTGSIPVRDANSLSSIYSSCGSQSFRCGDALVAKLAEF